MNQNRARPGLRQRSSAALPGKATAKHVSGRNHPVSFILPVDDHYRLTADERCWRIEQRREDGEWRPIEYHMGLEAAATSLARRGVRTSEVRTLADALAAVKNATRTLARAFAASAKAEGRP